MQTKTTGDAKNDRRPSPAPVKAPPVAGKCPNAGTDAGCFCTGACKGIKKVDYEYNGCREGWYD